MRLGAREPTCLAYLAGTFRFAGGDEYVGGWKRGERHGEGTERYHTGDEYEGEFRENAKDGRGMYRYTLRDRTSRPALCRSFAP
jgi:hypothetical protein